MVSVVSCEQKGQHVCQLGHDEPAGLQKLATDLSSLTHLHVAQGWTRESVLYLVLHLEDWPENRGTAPGAPVDYPIWYGCDYGTSPAAQE